MAVKIRFSRVGKKNTPVYRIIATDSRCKRDGASLEILGTYDPIKGILTQYKQDRVDYWVSQGAQVTDAVRKLQKRSQKNPTVVKQSVVAQPVVEQKGTSQE